MCHMMVSPTKPPGGSYEHAGIPNYFCGPGMPTMAFSKEPESYSTRDKKMEMSLTRKHYLSCLSWSDAQVGIGRSGDQSLSGRPRLSQYVLSQFASQARACARRFPNKRRNGSSATKEEITMTAGDGSARAFDVIVIGTGSGVSIADSAIAEGKTVAIVEAGPFGGTCVNRGCIPSKQLIHSADIVEIIQHAGDFGVIAHVDSIDWDKIVGRAITEADDAAASIEARYRGNSLVTVYKGEGLFVGHKTMEVNGERITAPMIMIGAGSRPVVATHPRHRRCAVSDVRRGAALRQATGEADCRGRRVCGHRARALLRGPRDGCDRRAARPDTAAH